MKVTFLKYHLGYKKGDSIETSTEQGTYWVRVGVAEETKAPNRVGGKFAPKAVKNEDDGFDL